MSNIHELPMETVYLYSLIFCAGLAFLFVIFGDIFHLDGPIDPVLMISWVAFTALFGYLGEHFFSVNALWVLILSSALSTGLVFLLYFYVLIPVKNAESTLSTSEKNMEGNVATVVTPIPVGGMGEIQLKSVTGSMNRPAAFYASQTTELKAGSQVLIIEIKQRVCYVVPYAKNFKI